MSIDKTIVKFEKELSVFLKEKSDKKERLNKEQVLLRDLLLIEIGAAHLRKGKKISRIETSFEKRYDKQMLELLDNALFKMKSDFKMNIRTFIAMGYRKLIVHFENSKITIHAYSK